MTSNPVEKFALLTYLDIERYINEHRDEYAVWLVEQSQGEEKEEEEKKHEYN